MQYKYIYMYVHIVGTNQCSWRNGKSRKDELPVPLCRKEWRPVPNHSTSIRIDRSVVWCRRCQCHKSLAFLTGLVLLQSFIIYCSLRRWVGVTTHWYCRGRRTSFSVGKTGIAVVRFPSAAPTSVDIGIALTPLELLVIGGSVPHHCALLVCVIEMRRNGLDDDGFVETNSWRDFWKVCCAAHCDSCI